jgi:hypothetical protein
MSLALIKQHLQTDGAHVGDILWWTLADARISRTQLESIWSGAGLSTSFLPEPPTPERALRTAVRECQVGHHQHLVRLGKEDDGELIFAVLLETRDGSGNVKTEQEARVRHRAKHRARRVALALRGPTVNSEQQRRRLGVRVPSGSRPDFRPAPPAGAPSTCAPSGWARAASPRSR